jgi:methoxylated aromatic compound---corrinoid protein Co-methyltransferase
VENVQAMIDFTLDYGTYSQSSNAPKSIEEIPPVDRPAQDGIPSPEQKRRIGVCVPWEEKKTELPPFQADEAVARRAWERVDSLGYTFCWVSLTW